MSQQLDDAPVIEKKPKEESKKKVEDVDKKTKKKPTDKKPSKKTSEQKKEVKKPDPKPDKSTLDILNSFSKGTKRNGKEKGGEGVFFVKGGEERKKKKKKI